MSASAASESNTRTWLFSSGCNFSGDFTEWTGQSAATTATIEVHFKPSVIKPLSSRSWINIWELLPELVFWPNIESSYDLPACEKSIHGKPRGRLKPPKLQLPRGHKPKINYNFYRKGTE